MTINSVNVASPSMTMSRHVHMVFRPHTTHRGMSHMTQVIEGPVEAWAGAEGHLGQLGLLVQGLRSSAVVLPCLFFLW